MTKDIDIKKMAQLSLELFPVNETEESKKRLFDALVEFNKNRPNLASVISGAISTAITTHGPYLGTVIGESLLRTVVLVTLSLDEDDDIPDDSPWNELEDILK